MASSTSIPMVVCGRNPGVAEAVRRMMAPEFDGTSNYDENVGSQNYSTIPRIIAVGGGYDPETREKIKAAVEQRVDANGLLWLWPDAEKRAQARAPPSTPKEFEAYAGGVVTRIKERASQHDFKESQGGVFHY